MFTLQAFNQIVNTLPEKDFHVYYSPMGSGKTYLVKDLISKNKSLVLAPYRSSRDDLGLEYSTDNNPFTSQFLYPNQLIRYYTNKVNSKNITNESTIIRNIRKLIQSSNKAYPLILLDEVDFMWVQARLELIETKYGWIKANNIFDGIIEELSKVTAILGFTASTIKHTSIPYTETILDADTSVKFESLTINLTNNINENKVFRKMLDESLDTQVPSLVYKKKYSKEDIEQILHFSKDNNVKSLVVLRKENAAYNRSKHDFDKAVMQELGYINIRRNNIQLTASNSHFILVGSDNSSLDTIVNGKDVFEYYDYVFINMSSSRQVSIPKKNGGSSVQLLSNANKLDEHILQAAGRFRENPIRIKVFLNHTANTFNNTFNGLDTIKQFDKTVTKYGLKDSTIYVVNRGNMQNLKGKNTSSTTQIKRDTLTSFLGSNINRMLSRRKLYPLYKAYHLQRYPNIKPFSFATFCNRFE